MKSVWFISMMICAFISCTFVADKVDNEAANEKLVQQYFQHFNNHDWQKMAEMYSLIAEFKDPSLGKDIVKQTRPEIIEKYTGLASMFPNVKDSVLQVYHSGNQQVIVEFISTGTAKDGSTFKLPICTIFTFENGLITKDYTYYDNAQAN